MLGCKIVAPIWLPLLGSNSAKLRAAFGDSRHEFCKQNSALFTLRVSRLLLHLKPNKKGNKNRPLLRSAFCWLPLLGSNQRQPVSTHPPNGGRAYLLARLTRAFRKRNRKVCRQPRFALLSASRDSLRFKLKRKGQHKRPPD